MAASLLEYPRVGGRRFLPLAASAWVFLCVLSTRALSPAAAPPVWRLTVAGVRVEVDRKGAAVRRGDGLRRTAWDPSPLVVFDACADPCRPFLYAVLAREGAERGERFAVVEVTPDGLRTALLDRDRGYNPWKVLSGDVDGDGEAEVLFVVYKKARLHPVLANRLFVFGWDGRQLYPKWLGSRLSHPFCDLALKDLDGDGVSEVVALEAEPDGGARAMSYRWSGFGFQADPDLARRLGDQGPAD
jgi:hypothetical protein